MDIVDDAPDPTDADNDPKGFVVGGLLWMVMVGLVVGLARAGIAIVGRPVQNLITGLKNVASNSVEQAQENQNAGSDIEVF